MDKQEYQQLKERVKAHRAQRKLEEDQGAKQEGFAVYTDVNSLMDEIQSQVAMNAQGSDTPSAD